MAISELPEDIVEFLRSASNSDTHLDDEADDLLDKYVPKTDRELTELVESLQHDLRAAKSSATTWKRKAEEARADRVRVAEVNQRYGAAMNEQQSTIRRLQLILSQNGINPADSPAPNPMEKP